MFAPVVPQPLALVASSDLSRQLIWGICIAVQITQSQSWSWCLQGSAHSHSMSTLCQPTALQPHTHFAMDPSEHLPASHLGLFPVVRVDSSQALQPQLLGGVILFVSFSLFQI